MLTLCALAVAFMLFDLATTAYAFSLASDEIQVTEQLCLGWPNAVYGMLMKMAVTVGFPFGWLVVARKEEPLFLWIPAVGAAAIFFCAAVPNLWAAFHNLATAQNALEVLGR